TGATVDTPNGVVGYAYIVDDDVTGAESPASVTATPSATLDTVDVTWAPPSAPSGTITGYHVQYSWDGASYWTTVANVDGDQTSASICCFYDGSYRFRVIADSSGTWSIPSNSTTDLVIVAQAPATVTVNPGGGDGDYVLSWTDSP